MSDHFQKEIVFLGIESSPGFLRAPEGSGCAERFIRALKENLFWALRFETTERRTDFCSQPYAERCPIFRGGHADIKAICKKGKTRMVCSARAERTPESR
jgi:hypothetical protein